MEKKIENKKEEAEVEVVEKKEFMKDLLNLKNYQSCIDSISDSITSVAESFVSIGRDLSMIKKDKLYTIDGYKDIYEFAKAKFGFGNTSTKNFINVYTKFGDTEASYACLKDEYEKYSLSQLIELLPVSDEDIKKYTPDQTVTQIREVKKISQMSDQDDKYIKEFNKMAEKVRSMFVEYLKLDSITSEVSYNENDMRYEDLFSFKFLDEEYKYEFKLSVGNCALNFTVDYADKWRSGCIYVYDDHFTTLLEKVKKGFKYFVESAETRKKEKEDKKLEIAKEKKECKVLESCKLKNNQARTDFVEDLNNWNLLSDLPEVNIQIYQFSVINRFFLFKFENNIWYFATNNGSTKNWTCGKYEIVNALCEMKY